MMSLCEQSFEPKDARRDRRTGLRSGKRAVLPIGGLPAIRRPLSTLGMALGYLGLVAILSMAPFLQQAIAPQHGQPLVCTDFGGSR